MPRPLANIVRNVLANPVAQMLRDQRGTPLGELFVELQDSLAFYDLHGEDRITQRQRILRWMLDTHLDMWMSSPEIWRALKAHRDTSMHTRLWLDMPTWTIGQGSLYSVLSTMARDNILERRARPDGTYEYRAGVLPYDEPAWQPPPLPYGAWRRPGGIG